MRSGVTLKDISKTLNISTTTVHRALTGKNGISDSLREKILETADQMGYKLNYAASSIKRATRYIAAILPEDNGLYFDYIWRGFRAMAKEAERLNIGIEEFVCRDEQHQYELLKQIADAGYEEYAGVVTLSYTRDIKVLMQLQRLIAQKIDVIVIDDELKEPEGLYCIPPNERTVGKVAAELTAMITPDKGKVLVSAGRMDSKIHQRKLQSFCEYLNEKKRGLQVQVVEGYYKCSSKTDQSYMEIEKAIKKYGDIVACYTLNARDNELMINVVKEAGLADRILIIGTDLSEISARMLRKGELKAIVNQGAYMKGYRGLEILVEHIIKHMDPPKRIDCPIDIILQGNLNFYESLNGCK